jgi:hypothetical protein
MTVFSVERSYQAGQLVWAAARGDGQQATPAKKS